MLRLTVLAATAAALVVTATANAKLTSITVSTPVAAPRIDVPWTVTIHVTLRGKPYVAPGYKPTLYLVSTGYIPAATFRGIRIEPGTFHVTVVFPRPASWRFVIPDPLNGEWSFIAPPAAA